MPRKPRSLKQEMDRLSAELRERGLTWTEIAERFQSRWGLNRRQAFREAHRYTQARVAEIWTSRWPDDPLTVRKLGAWEAWPLPSGNEPAIASLNRLASIYRCRAADLVDGEDHSAADEHAHPARSRVDGRRPGGTLQPKDIEAVVSAVPGQPSDAAAPVTRPRDTEFERLVQALVAWAGKMKRRDALALLAAAATAAYASPLLDRLNDDELERVALAAADPSRVDDATIDHVEAVLRHAHGQEDALGPHAVLVTVLAQDHLVRSLLPGASGDRLRRRLLSLRSEILRFVGWMLFNLNDFNGAEHYFGQARSAAHEADDDAMSAMALANWSQMSTWRGDPRLGVEHALGTLAWGRRAGSRLLVSYGHDVEARAYAAVARRSAKDRRGRDRTRCLRSLDSAHNALAAATADDPGSRQLYFYGDAMHVSTRTGCLLTLGDTAEALPSATRTVQRLDPAFTRNLAYARLKLADAYTQSPKTRSIEAACEHLGAAAALAGRNTSPRLARSVRQAREALAPWHRTRAVADLDEKLHTYGLTA